MLWLVLVISAALLAGLLPIWFAFTIVMVFGAPHNWLEFRYFLARMPSQIRPVGRFFAVAFLGATLLAVSQSTIFYFMQQEAIEPSFARWLFLAWNELLLFWISLLFFTRYRHVSKAVTLLTFFLIFVMTMANILSPLACISMLAYAHPVLGLCILERELRRSRKSWLRQYHWGLLLIPVGCTVLLATLGMRPADPVYVQTLVALSGNTIYRLLDGVSPVALLAIWAFLQMIHYGVWILIVPIASRSWSSYRLERVPVLRRSPGLRTIAAAVSGGAALLVLIFWCGFYLDGATTMRVYTLLAVLHVLAEIPFLFWMVES